MLRITFCTRCGFKANPKDKFCTNCGSKLETPIHKENLSININGFNYSFSSLKVYNLFRQSQDFIARRDTYSARRSLTQALEIEPNNASILVQLGITFFLRNGYEEGISYFEKALEIDPNHLIALEILMEHYIKEGEPEKVQIYFDRLKSIAPKYSELLVNRGDTLFKDQKSHQAVELWKNALLFTPRNYEIMARINNIAEQDFMDKLLKRFSSIQEAKEFYKQKSEQDPEDTFARKMILWAERRSLGLNY